MSGNCGITDELITIGSVEIPVVDLPQLLKRGMAFDSTNINVRELENRLNELVQHFWISCSPAFSPEDAVKFVGAERDFLEEFLEKICIWSTSQLVANNVKKARRDERLWNSLFPTVLRLVADFDKSESPALNSKTATFWMKWMTGEVEGVGPFISSSILRFFIPRFAPAFNGSVSKRISDHTNFKCTAKGWNQYRQCCSDISVALNNVNFASDMTNAPWRVADIDLVVWQYDREHPFKG
jgi:hypothetical protein